MSHDQMNMIIPRAAAEALTRAREAKGMMAELSAEYDRISAECVAVESQRADLLQAVQDDPTEANAVAYASHGDSQRLREHQLACASRLMTARNALVDAQSALLEGLGIALGT